MSLTISRGPLSPQPAGWFSSPVPPDLVYVEPHPRRIRASLGGRVVIDTERALLVHRPNSTLSYAFLPEEVGGLPHSPLAEAAGYVTVPWDAVDTWTEEGRTLVHYPPNPYHRVDCRPTDRGLRVEVGGAVLVDTIDTMILFETSLAPVNRNLLARPARRYSRPTVTATLRTGCWSRSSARSAVKAPPSRFTGGRPKRWPNWA